MTRNLETRIRPRGTHVLAICICRDWKRVGMNAMMCVSTSLGKNISFSRCYYIHAMTKTSRLVSFNDQVSSMNQRFTLSHVQYFIDSVGLDEDDLNALIEHLQDKQRAQSASI